MSFFSACFGILSLTCQQPVTELAFTPGAQPIPHEFRLEDRGAQTTVLVSIAGATFATAPAIAGATVIASSATSVQVAGSGAIAITGLALNVSGADVGDEVTALVRIVDPNRAVLLSEQTVRIATVRGVDRFRVPFFNPSTNRTQETLLRLSAANGEVVAVVTGRDDAGNRSGKGELLVEAGKARTVTAAQLEALIGAPVGKWRLTIDTDAPGLTVQALVRNANTGTITTISDTVGP